LSRAFRLAFLCRNRHITWNVLERSQPESEILPVIRSMSRRVMKRPDQVNRALSELSALASVVGLLAAATLAKFGVATQFFHLSH
jgi:hypothetical protein